MTWSSQTVTWFFRIGAFWTDPETLCRLAATSTQFRAADEDEHWRVLAGHLLLRPLQADVQGHAFEVACGASRNAMKTKVLKLYYPVFQVRRRVRSIWRNIELLWGRLLPEALENLLPGIGEQELEEVEGRLGCQLPEDLAESFRIHEGMKECGRRKGQFLFELDREDPYVFATFQLRPARQLPEIVEEERRKAIAKIPLGANFVAGWRSFMASQISLTAVACLEREKPRFTPAGPWVPFLASDCLSDDVGRTPNILVAFPHRDRMTVLQAILSQLEQYPEQPPHRTGKRNGDVRPFGAVAFLRIFGFCGPTWYGHCNCFEQFLSESMDVLQTIQLAWSKPCSVCEQDWPGWHCSKCKRIVGESFPDALERLLPVREGSMATFDRYSWWAAAVRSYGWDCPEYLYKRMQGKDAPFLGLLKVKSDDAVVAREHAPGKLSHGPPFLMTTLLAKQVAAFRHEHGISSLGPKRTAPPSVLFTPQEAKRLDPEAFAALALRGVEQASLLDPEIASYGSLFEGPQRDRDLMTREENAALDEKIHHLLLLLSPHLQATSAQECLEGLLYRYHAHRWNVDDLMGAALPHHDSPLFTKLVQGLHVEGKPLWSWLATLKAKPAALLRSALAKYCAKDIAVLIFVGKVMEENLKLQKANRALMTFYAALWLDTLALQGSLGQELVQALLPTLLLMLRRPRPKDAFHAGLTIAGALCTKVELEASVQSKIIHFAARQAKGAEGQPATALMAALLQLQAVQSVDSGAVKALAKNGPEELLEALPVGVDCGNLLASVVKAGLGQLADPSEASEEIEALILGLLRDAPTLRRYAAPLSAAVLQAFVSVIAGNGSAKERKRVAKLYQEPVQLLSGTVPAALAEAIRRALDQALALELDTEPLVSLLAPACAAVKGEEGDQEEKLLPAVQAFQHKSAKVRSRAVQNAVAKLGDDQEEGTEVTQERRRLMASLALQSLDDENVEVVAVALKQETLWTSLEVAPSTAADVLSAALRRLLRHGQPKGNPKTLQELFRSLLQEDSRVRALFPLMIQASAWVYGREDAEQERRRLDALLLPPLLLAFAGLDAAEEVAGPLLRLEEAAAEFCKVSEEPLLKGDRAAAEAAEGCGPRISAVAQAADDEACERLADLAGAQAEVQLLAGLGSQVAAALALSAAMPRQKAPNKPTLLLRGAAACQRLAKRLVASSLTSDFLKGLWKACLEAATSPGGGSSSSRRKSGKTSLNGAGSVEAATLTLLLEVALMRPKAFAGDLHASLTGGAAALRPALLQLSLGSHGGPPGIRANALLLLRSLLVNGWAADQMMLVLILSRLASTEEKQVRAASVAVLESLQAASLQDDSVDTLVEAKLLLPTASVAPEKVCSSMGQLPQELWSNLLELLLQQKAELLQDPVAAHNVLQKVLGLKGGLPKASREQASRFWLFGLARLEPQLASGLTTALPGALSLRSAQDPLAKTAQWAAKSAAAPSLLLAAFSMFLHLAAGALMSAAEKIRSAAQDAAVEAMRQVVLPFASGLTQLCEKAKEAPSWDAQQVRIAGLTCEVLSKVAGAFAAHSVQEELVTEALKVLFRYSLAARALGPADGSFASVVAKASAALSEAPMQPGRLLLLLEGSEFRGSALKAARVEVAAEILCEQVAGLEATASAEDSAKLLRKLAEAAGAMTPQEQLRVTLRREQGLEVRSRRSCVSFGQMTLSATAMSDAVTLPALPSFRETYLYRCCKRNVRSSDVLADSAFRDEEEDLDLSQIRVQSRPQQLSLCIPACPSALPVLNAWASTAMKSLAGLAGGLPLVQAMQALGSGGGTALDMPLKLGGVGSIDAFLEESEKSLATHVGLFSLTSAVMFIGSIKGLNKHSTAREGNYMGMVATALGILSVLLSPGFHSAHIRFFLTFLAAGGVGYGIASTVKMEDMPQLVAGFHSFVGLAAVFAGFASYCNVANPYTVMKALETVVGIAIGSLTFTGSVVAAGKLHEMIPGKPIILPQRWLLNGGALAGSAVLTALFLNPATYASHAGAALLLGNTALWGFLGVNMVLPIGGADMPVVVSLLNAFSGLATSAAGFMLSNDLLTISGALIASSGTLLSDIMCRGINRSMYNVLLGGFGTDSSSTTAGAAVSGGRENVSEVSAVGFVGMLFGAKKVVIVPGYGLAVARCQQKLAEIVAMLRKHNVTVHFAIHPVAGRMPGHMNVLLAEADVPYDIVQEMDEINAELPTYDVGIVVGANDIVNPATQDDPSSPIYGMPAIEIWKCKQCVVLKRSMGTGYSGEDNPLFYLSNVKMLFGDAKQSMDNISSCLEDSQDRFTAAAGASSSGDHQDTSQGVEPEVFPEAVRVIGILRERLPGEARVSFAPSAVVKLRRMGFSILLEAGSGTAAGFTDEEYTRHGGVQVAESSVEVLKQADIIFKVTEPLLDEVQMLQGTQTMVGFWNMYGTQELLAALAQTSASVLNLALVPRVSRAQKLDALTSMANIAGYRAILDAFGRFPRFSRAGSTAFGSVPPAKVFVIGAGVAGLSAIATAHSLGCKVFANDVRDAAREQVESMGAQFIAVDAQGIAGEGAGGYATVMGEDFTRAQIATYARVIPDMDLLAEGCVGLAVTKEPLGLGLGLGICCKDVIVTTAMIPNRAAPELITSEMVASMRKGSVIIDLAAQTGGNCVYTEPNKAVVSPNGVTVVGETNYASQMASQSSEMLGSNFTAMLEVLGGAQNFGGEHWDDPVVKPAIVARGGAVVWDPNPPRPPAAAPTGTAVEGNGIGGFGGASPMPLPPPEEANAVIAWIQEHKDELALGVGGAVVLGLGLAVDIPEAEVTHLGYFVLSCLIGNFTVAGVTPALHTPLISVTNAISGIIVVGGMLQLSGPVLSARVACALAAVFLSSVNIVGGFAAGRQSGGALVPLLLALATLTDKLTQAAADGWDVSAVADEVPEVCRCIDQVAATLPSQGLAPVLRCCGGLATLAAPGVEGEAAFATCTGALRQHAQPLRPELLALLRGNLRRLWRQPLTESDWALQSQVRLRTLLGTIFDSGLIEVSRSNCLALAQSAGVRASLDFIILLLLVHRLARPPPTPKRRKRKRRSEPDELEEEIEALSAPAEEDLVLDEALDALLSVDPASMYHCLGMLLLTLSACAVDLCSESRLPWAGPLLQEACIAEEENIRLRPCPRATPLRRFPLRHMPEYELLYWPVSGLAEPIRLTFVVAGIPFKDTTPLTDPEFNDRKLALHPYAPDAAGLPILVFDGKVCCQSRAILRYIGRLAQHEGAFLYPTEDPLEQLLCDELIDLSEDLRRPMSATVTTQYKDAAEKEAYYESSQGRDNYKPL
eukprot:s392_g21.t1